MTDRCAIPGCQGEFEVFYFGRGVCGFHWDQLNNQQNPAEALARALGITEETHMRDEMTETTDQNATAPVAQATPETTMKGKTKTSKATKTAKATTTKKEKPAKAVTATKAAKELKPKKDTGPKPDRTFAIRVTTEELEALHKSCGPRGATRIVRALTVAFVNEDESQFRSLVKEARESRA